jgi:glucose/arabinose dehydrogenase
MFRNVEKGSEGGLLGLAIDPDFNNSHYIFIYETATTNQVVRLKYENGALTEDKVILSGISKASSHDGGALKFGPDGYLYVGTGDALKRDSAQLRSSLLGKILRIDKNGDAAQGNPFSTRVWSYGHRNVQGFDWMPDGKMIGIEHGPTIEFGWCCHDEINYIQPAKNYGWPLVMGDASADTLTAPLIHSGNETWAPSGCTFIKGKQWGDWENNLLVGGLKSTNLLRFKLNNQPSVTFKSDTLKNVYQRLRNVIEAPDGSIYFGSSNVGITSPMPLAGDDKIYRLAFE